MSDGFFFKFFGVFFWKLKFEKEKKMERFWPISQIKKLLDDGFSDLFRQLNNIKSAAFTDAEKIEKRENSSETKELSLGRNWRESEKLQITNLKNITDIIGDTTSSDYLAKFDQYFAQKSNYKMDKIIEDLAKIEGVTEMDIKHFRKWFYQFMCPSKIISTIRTKAKKGRFLDFSEKKYNSLRRPQKTQFLFLTYTHLKNVGQNLLKV